MTPMKAIRAKYLDCCCGFSNEVRLCPIKKCPLYSYRFGKNPNRSGIGNHNVQFYSKKTISAQDSEDESRNEYTSTTHGTETQNSQLKPG